MKIYISIKIDLENLKHLSDFIKIILIYANKLYLLMHIIKRRAF